MVGIPRFDAQLSRVSVPTMQNFQQDQNEQIYKAVAGVANTASNIATKLYEEQQKYNAQVQGAEDVKKAQEGGKEYKLSELPTPYTAAQKAYNESAVNAFAAQYTVDTSFALTNIEDENRDNPFEFLKKAQSYIDGASKDIPEHLKPSIVKPLEMNMRSIYSSLLKKKIESNRKASQATTMISLEELSRSAQNEEDASIQAEKIGQLVTIATNAASSGDITGEYATKIITNTRKGVASQRLTNQLLNNINDPAKINAVINMAMKGETGIEAFDTLSPIEKAEATKDALGHISYAKGYLGQVAEMAGKYEINKAQLDMYNSLSGDEELTPEVMQEISWGNKNFYKMMVDSQNNSYSASVEAMIGDIEQGISNGSIESDDIMKAYDGGYITGGEAIFNLNQIFSPLSQNKKKSGYDIFKTNLDSELRDIMNGIGVVSKTNVKKKYIEDNMEKFLSTGDKTDQEILEYSDVLYEKANKRFSKDAEYESVYTPSWFKEKTGYSISVIENAVAEASVGGQLDMEKLRQILLDMTGNDEHQANSLYSMYMAVKNQ